VTRVGWDVRGGTITQIHKVAILIPLMVGVSAVVCTILIHALAVGAMINFVRYERTTGRAGKAILQSRGDWPVPARMR
jgi:hypothetical protein